MKDYKKSAHHSVRVSSTSSCIRNANEILAKYAAEDGGAKRAIIFEDFIADIPLIFVLRKLFKVRDCSSTHSYNKTVRQRTTLMTWKRDAP